MKLADSIGEMGIATRGAVAFLLTLLFALSASADDKKPAPQPTANADPAPVVKFTPEQLENAHVKLAAAGPGQIAVSVDLPGEIRLNEDKEARVTPAVGGIVIEVSKNLGDPVHAGESLAVLASKDLAVAKAAYLAAKDQATLAETTAAREESLWKKKISAEQDYLAAKQALSQARIALRSAEQQLCAVGFSMQAVKKLSPADGAADARYLLTAPIDGEVIDKTVVLGDSPQPGTSMFTVADLGTVWADFSVSPKDLPSVAAGQELRVAVTDSTETQLAKIAYVGPTLGQDTRAALARAILPNPKGVWKPGMFVTGSVTVSRVDVAIAVPRAALTRIDGKPSVFVQTGDGFAASEVTVGREAGDTAEITAGLKAGQAIVVQGVGILKSELDKAKGGGQ